MLAQLLPATPPLLLLTETALWESFHGGWHWQAGIPWPRAWQHTRKEGADGPVLAGCRGERACKHLSCTVVLTWGETHPHSRQSSGACAGLSCLYVVPAPCGAGGAQEALPLPQHFPKKQQGEAG